MEMYEDSWKNVKESQRIPTFGLEREAGLESVTVNVGRMIRSFRLGVKDLMEIWRKWCPETTFGWSPLDNYQMRSSPCLKICGFVWSMTCRRLSQRFFPQNTIEIDDSLYLGRVASFIKENQESRVHEAEGNIESLCKVFEEMKPYLIDRWTS
jgi:hypothetical protein